MSEDLTWFWAIVDKEGFADVPSNERDALRILSQKASERDALREENARLREALEPFADGVDCYTETASDEYPVDYGHFFLGNLRAAAAAIREGGKE